MTTYDRGDVVLFSFPVSGPEDLHARPAVILHDAEPRDTAVSVAPLTSEPLANGSAIHIELGSYEAARMGLVTSAYLNRTEEIVVDRQFLIRKLGKCPRRLTTAFFAMLRAPLKHRNFAGERPDAAPLSGEFSQQSA